MMSAPADTPALPLATGAVSPASTSAGRGSVAAESVGSSGGRPVSATPQRKKCVQDFIFGKVLGEGSFSTVFLAKEFISGREFAIKVLEKQQMIKEQKQEYVMREKNIFELLGRHGHPFFVKLYATFQDPQRLYFVLSYEPNGELLHYIRLLSAFDVESTRFYSAEIAVALEHLYSIGIIHRDLKPENVLLSKDMHIRLTDFGSAKMVNEKMSSLAERNSAAPPEGTSVADAGSTSRRKSFVGTAQYVSPEVLQSKKVGYESDLWALGCMIYQFISGDHPFKGGNEYQIFQRIVKLDYKFPEGFDSLAKDLVGRLLLLEPDKRLGSEATGSFKALKAHAFYAGTDWDRLFEQKPPDLLPYLPAQGEGSEHLWSEAFSVGLDEQHHARLMVRAAKADVGDISVGDAGAAVEELLPTVNGVPAKEVNDDERKRLLAAQSSSNDYHRFVDGNLILMQGLLDKRKGLFARRRMFLLTEGPNLYYVDPVNMVIKGKIPWTRELRPEVKSFKIFFVHTPNRTYYLEDPQGYAVRWVKKIEDVWKRYYGPVNPKRTC